MKSQDSMYILKWSKKLRAIELLGGKCSVCGNSNFINLDFHHNKDKEYLMSDLFKGKRWSDIEKEMKKCVLLCRNCHGEFHGGNTWVSKLKIKLLELKCVDSCKRCGYKGVSLDFHHRHNEEKSFSIGNAYKFITNKRKEVEEEIEKCDVICRNCHSIEHFDFERFTLFKKNIDKKIIGHRDRRRNANVELIIQMNKEGFSNKEISDSMNILQSTVSMSISKLNLNANIKNVAREETKICLFCKNSFDVFGEEDINKKKYCSIKCKHNGDRKLNIEKKDLEEMLKIKTCSQIARDFNVVHNTVKNLMRRYEIIK